MRARLGPAASRARRARTRFRARRAAPPSAGIGEAPQRGAPASLLEDARRPVEPRRDALAARRARRRARPRRSTGVDESGEPAGGGGGRRPRIWAASSASMRASAASAAATSAAVGCSATPSAARSRAGAGGAAFFVGVSSSSSLRTASAFSFDARRRCGETSGRPSVACARRVCERLRPTASLGPPAGGTAQVVRARSEMVRSASLTYAASLAGYLVGALCNNVL